MKPKPTLPNPNSRVLSFSLRKLLRPSRCNPDLVQAGDGTLIFLQEKDEQPYFRQLAQSPDFEKFSIRTSLPPNLQQKKREQAQHILSPVEVLMKRFITSVSF